MADSRTVIIADLDALLTEYLADMLERHGYHARIAPPVHDAVRDWVRRFGAELCITALALRDGDDIALTVDLVSQVPATKVIVRTANTSTESMQAALAAGAAGYIHKSRGPVVLLETLARVAAGEVVVEGSFTAAPVTPADGQADFHRLVEALAPRQRECLDMMTDGKGTFAMATALGVSTMTVRTHVQAMLARLGVRSRLEALSLVAKYQLPDAA